MKRFFSPDNSDKRIFWTEYYLETNGFTKTNSEKNADFILLGVNPKTDLSGYDMPVFAGNVKEGKNIYDYTKIESFATENAYLTAEGAISLAVQKSEKSLINTPILICGYGRIGKALHRYLEPFTKDITICARNADIRTLCESLGTKTISPAELDKCKGYSFIFNTIPHPVFNEKELKSMEKSTLLIDLASFPGGVDEHYAKALGINLIIARGLPGKYSPKSAGKTVAKTIINIIKEEGL